MSADTQCQSDIHTNQAAKERPEGVQAQHRERTGWRLWHCGLPLRTPSIPLWTGPGCLCKHCSTCTAFLSCPPLLCLSPSFSRASHLSLYLFVMCSICISDVLFHSFSVSPSLSQFDRCLFLSLSLFLSPSLSLYFFLSLALSLSPALSLSFSLSFSLPVVLSVTSLFRRSECVSCCLPTQMVCDQIHLEDIN